MRALLVVAIIGRVASAQTAADGAQPPPANTTPRTPAPPHEWCDCNVELGAALGGGVVGESGRPTGWQARLDYTLAFAPRPGRRGGELAFHLGFDYWRAGPDWGLQLPVSVNAGARVGMLRATLGLGFDVLLVDQVASSTGVGLYAPFAVARLGVVAGSVTIDVDARATYRWQFGSTSRGQLDVALLVGYVMRGPRARGVTRARAAPS